MRIDELTDQQKVLFELWTVFDEICRKNDISYMLFAGTALGAVRHQGIIPWDDDLDVVMMRKDYEHFLQVAAEQIDEEQYYLQAEFSDHWPLFFSKLRKNNTTFLEKCVPKDPLMHQGVYIDIFPCDNLADNKFVRKLQFAASKIIIAKSLDKRGYLTDSRLKKLFMKVCRVFPRRPLLALIQLRGKSHTNGVHTFLGAAKSYSKNVYPRKWFLEFVEMHFCEKTAPVTKRYDAMLKKLYGDYHVIPSEEERSVKVHSEIVDLHRPYTEYLEMQKQMKYKTYARSIR